MARTEPKRAPSAFDELGLQKTVDALLAEIRALYLSDTFPWVVGYSGGKDSTATLQLVWLALAGLDSSERTKPVHVISTDTLVENPIVAAWVERSLDTMRAAAERAGANRKVLKALMELFDADRRQREASGEGASYLSLSTEARSMLSGVRASFGGEVPARIGRLLARADALGEKVTALERAKATTPEEERVVDLSARRAEARAELMRAEDALGAIEASLLSAEREHEHKADRWKRLADRAADERKEQEATERVVVYAERVRGTMKRFRQALLEKRIQRVEALVLEGFQRLLRKESLITGLSIDPRTFAMTLFGADRRALSPERLSAGERQLLAVSIIGALARASGRSLPVVIDTPLGRLDSVHRDRLVERYFPFASHQVILLSTDKEIDRAHYEKLAPYIGRAYTLHHDDRTGTTTIEPGYFF